MRILVLFLALFPLVALAQNQSACPSLAAVDHVSGRLATEADIDAGAAIFMLQVDGKRIGTPMDLDVPQYAIHNDSLSGQKMSVIVVQAEETGDQKVIGALGCASNEFSIGLIGDFELLGTSRP